MPCYRPLQASFSVRSDGKKDLSFKSSVYAKLFSFGKSLLGFERAISLPCGKCIGCRLERSRQWATRMVHEASLHERNSFLTLTYHPDFVPANGSLLKRDVQLFIKRLRSTLVADSIRYFMCGEYGENFDRPHYHVCLFGLDFDDKKVFSKSNDNYIYTSDLLDHIWQLGFCTIGDLTFDSAAYVARYCIKKVNGEKAAEHYAGRQPEFGLMSLKPGIGYQWFHKWKEDCYPSDFIVVNGAKCKPPRYYDKEFKKLDPVAYELLKTSRRDGVMEDHDNSHDRLLVRETCHELRGARLVRKLEVSL